MEKKPDGNALGAGARHVIVTGGEAHSLAVRPDGKVWAWGSNSNNQLGAGFGQVQLVPAQSVGPQGIVSVAAGWRHSMALEGDPGNVWTWGDDSRRQLGNGFNTYPFPQRLPGYMEACSEIAAGAFHSLARYKDLPFVWGDNDFRELADPSIPMSNTPRSIVNMDRVAGIAAGGLHSIVWQSNGTILAFGAGGVGQLGDGTTPLTRAEPKPVTGLGAPLAISAGEMHNLAITPDEKVWAWGFNTSGQVGDGTFDLRPVPVEIGLDDITAVAAGALHSLALHRDGTVLAWGSNSHGQIGEGGGGNRNRPIKLRSLENIIAIGAGLDHSLAVDESGSVWAWGRNSSGQLGDGTQTNRDVPVQAQGTGGP